MNDIRAMVAKFSVLALLLVSSSTIAATKEKTARAAQTVSTQPAEFKGIRLGERLDVAKLKDEWQFRCDPKLEVVEVCDGRTSIADAEAHMTVSVSKDMVLQRIRLSFMSSEFEQVERALSQKFGKPYFDEASQVRSKVGVWWPQRKVRWKASEGAEIFAVLRSKDINIAIVVYSSAVQLAADERAVDEAIRRRSADL